MFTSLETGLGLDIVLAVQDVSHPLLDALSLTIYFAGTELGYFLLAALVYWGVSRRLGLVIVLAVIFGGAMNTLIKEIIQAPRPFVVSAEVDNMFPAQGYGFPSGHVMNAMIVWGYIAWVVRRPVSRRVMGAVLIHALVVGWARIYAGAHYPQDVIGGIILSLPALWILFYIDLNWLPGLYGIWWRLHRRAQVAVVVLIVIFSAVYLSDHASVLGTGGALAGIALGMALWRFEPVFPLLPGLRAWLFLAGGALLVIAIFGGVYALGGVLFAQDSTAYRLVPLPAYGLAALAAYALWPLLARRYGLLARA